MRRALHRYFLPPCFLILYVVLLVPLLVPYKADPEEPDSLPKGRLNAGYALPLGVAAFLCTALDRAIVGFSSLPRAPERRVLAEALEWVLIFTVGFAEEL